jgi:hypothetical protein
MHVLESARRALGHFTAALNTPPGKAVQHVLRWAIPVVLLVLLARSLTQIGLLQVWRARPASLAFYGVLFLPFFIQPLADLAIYRNLLPAGTALPLTVLLRKRFLNAVALDYSGEAYFYLWARHHLVLPKGLLVHAVKDSNVLSAGAGLVVVWLMLLALVASGVMKLPGFLSAHYWTFLSVGSLPLVLSCVLIVGGRRVTSLSRSQVAMTFAVHLARSITTLAFDFAAWWLSGALPSAAVCLEFVALRLLVSRLPLIPNKDLIFVGAGIAAAGAMDLSAPGVAAVVILLTASGQLQEFGFVGLPWLFEQFRARRRLEVL